MKLHMRKSAETMKSIRKKINKVKENGSVYAGALIFVTSTNKKK